MVPAANSALAASSRGGRSRPPTWSARKGGVLRIGAIVAVSGQAGQAVAARAVFLAPPRHYRAADGHEPW
jgi:hypothetical protein